MEESAYEQAVELLLAGAMPIVVDCADGIHVLSILPTDQAGLASMVNDDPLVRLKFMASVVIAVKEKFEEEAHA